MVAQIAEVAKFMLLQKEQRESLVADSASSAHSMNIFFHFLWGVYLNDPLHLRIDAHNDEHRQTGPYLINYQNHNITIKIVKTLSLKPPENTMLQMMPQTYSC